MDRTDEKLGKFSEMVMQESGRKKSEHIHQAELDKKEFIASSEIQYLKNAYEKIQDVVRRLDKEYNEEVSKAIVESKQALFNRRDEIIELVFSGARKRLLNFVKTDEYKPLMESLIKLALAGAGNGEIRVVVEAEDLALFEEIRKKLNADFAVMENNDAMIGGFLIINKNRGFIWDYSFLSRLTKERTSFLEKYALSID